jgi:copper chaperone CopZ
MDACRDCRKELRLRTRLKLRLIDAGLPGAPVNFRARLAHALDAADRPAPKRRWWFAAAAAAILATASLLIFVPEAPAVPSVIAASSEFHDRVLEGSVAADPVASADALRAYFRERLKLEVAAPDVGGGCCLSGACPCPMPDKPAASPWIVYRKGPAVLSLLVLETADKLPESARRTYAGREYHVFRAGANTVVACRSDRLCHLWIARLDEKAMLDLVLEIPEGRKAFGSGERLTLRGVTCRACCATVEARAREIPGVTDARVDLESMELIVIGKADLNAVIEALQRAGIDASRPVRR